MNPSPQAKPIGTEWCKCCNAWKEYDSAGRCRTCDKLLFRESTADMLAELASKGYVLN